MSNPPGKPGGFFIKYYYALVDFFVVVFLSINEATST